MSDLPKLPWYYYLRRWVRKCHHRHPQLLESEWGTAPGSGIVDVYCGRHRSSVGRWAGTRPIDDLPWIDRVLDVLKEDNDE